MKHFLSVVIIISFSLAAIAQSPLSLVSDSTLVTGGADINELVAYSRIYNNGSDTIEVYWSRFNESLPLAWGSTAICDNNQCYLPPVDFSPDPVIIAPGTFSNLDVHFTPEDTPGEGTVGIRAWVIGDSAATVVTGFYKATAEEPTGLAQSKTNENISIYPNPAKDYILIKNLPINESSTVEVFNIFGRKMLSFSQPPSVESTAHKFDLSALAKGIYMIRVYDGDINVIYTKSLSKE